MTGWTALSHSSSSWLSWSSLTPQKHELLWRFACFRIAGLITTTTTPTHWQNLAEAWNPNLFQKTSECVKHEKSAFSEWSLKKKAKKACYPSTLKTAFFVLVLEGKNDEFEPIYLLIWNFTCRNSLRFQSGNNFLGYHTDVSCVNLLTR